MTDMVLGIDPGKTTGIAFLDFEGNLLKAHNANVEKVKAILQKKSLMDQVKQIVMEQFVLYRNKAGVQVGSKMPASKIIGMIELWASMNKVPVKMQMANILPIAIKWSRVEPEGSHSNNHWVDAYNHAYYWLVKEKRIITPFERELRDDR